MRQRVEAGRCLHTQSHQIPADMDTQDPNVSVSAPNQKRPMTMPAATDLVAYRDLLPHLTTGAGAVRHSSGVSAPAGREGHAVHGPKWPLGPGAYLASFFIAAAARWPERNTALLVIEVVDGEVFLGQSAICGRDAENGVFDVPFVVPRGAGARAVELRVWSWGIVPAEITRIAVVRRPG